MEEIDASRLIFENNLIRSQNCYFSVGIVSYSLLYTFISVFLLNILVSKHILFSIVIYLIPIIVFKILLNKHYDNIRSRAEEETWYTRLDSKDIKHELIKNNKFTHEDNSSCVICYKKKKEYITLNQCSHKFCTDCLATWCSKKNTCPMCREPILEMFD